MNSARLEAFSDGVIAIIITIMVLELKVPHGDDFDSLLPIVPVFCSYVLSFVYVGIYWTNHHHMLQACEEVKGSILWANLHFLCWLSLFPVSTAWMGEAPHAAAPTASYGIILVMASISYLLLQQSIIAAQGAGSLLKKAVGTDWKGRWSTLLYLAGIALAWVQPRVAQGLYLVVALLWLVPDRRIAAPCVTCLPIVAS